jgi:HK97 family phage portal protein
MSAQLLQLDTARHSSRVLGAWLAGREGAAQRLGHGADVSTPQASGENAVSTNLSYSDLATLYGMGSLSSAGVAVTKDTALRVATVYACIDRIAGAIKSLPFKIFERLDSGSEPVNHDYHWLFNERACADWTAADAWAYLIGAKFLEGDGYAELLRPSISSSRIIGWQPLLHCRPFRDSRSQNKYYRVTRPDGSIDILDPADVVQLPSQGYDGLTSPSAITYAAHEAVGLSLAGQRWAGSFFRDGATFDYVLKAPGSVDEKQRELIARALLGRASGSRAPLILANGLEPAQLTINPKDAEILATRLFSVEEICRIFGVPPYMVGHTEKNSSWGTGMEQQGSNFVRYTLAGHLTQIRQEFNHKLWPTRSRYFAEHVTAALERGDLKARNEAYRVALGRAGEQPWMTINEIRAIENLGDMPAGADPEPPQVPEGAPDAP